MKLKICGKWPSKLIQAVGICLLIQGCATTVKPTKIDPLADVQSELDVTKRSLEEAVAMGVNIYSPNFYQNAERAYKNAEEHRGNGADSETIFKSLGMARSYLEKAQQRSTIVHSGLPNATQAREAAIAADAPKLKSEDFTAVENKFIQTNSEFEDGETNSISKADSEFTKSYVRLETDAIKEKLLAEARSNIKQAESEDAEKWAPQTLSKVRAQLDQIDKSIEQDRYSNKLAETSQELTTASTDLLAVTREAKRVAKTDAESLVLQNKTAEQALQIERENLERTATALQNAESREENLAQSVEVENKYKDVESQFSKDEADVLRQGSLLIIRLKNIQFKTGRSAINPTSFATLKKVHDSLSVFDSPKIRVEGHTDSTGPKNLNAKLSLERASAIANYLSAQGVATADMEVVGRGESQPVASNNTAAGRSQNRRVDIVVESRSKNITTN